MEGERPVVKGLPDVQHREPVGHEDLHASLHRTVVLDPSPAGTVLPLEVWNLLLEAVHQIVETLDRRIARLDQCPTCVVRSPHVGPVLGEQPLDPLRSDLSSLGGGHVGAVGPIQPEAHPLLMRVIGRRFHPARPIQRVRVGLAALPPAHVDHHFLEPQGSDVIDERIEFRLHRIPTHGRLSRRGKRVPLHLGVARILPEHLRHAVPHQPPPQPVGRVVQITPISPHKSGAYFEHIAPAKLR